MKKNSGLKNNIQAILTGTYESGVCELNTLCDLALVRLDRNFETPSIKKCKPLTWKQKWKIWMFYRPYIRCLTTRYHRLYTEKSGGKFFVEYMPEEFYATTIDRFYSDRKESMYVDNKCFYYQLFPTIRQPELVAMRVGGQWRDRENRLISMERVLQRIEEQEEVVLKQATSSEGGKGVYFLNGTEKKQMFLQAQKRCAGDLVIQKSVHQHPDMARLHKESVNTIRVLSLITENKVKVYQACVRIGVDGNRTDNGITGGIYAGIRPDGSVKERGCYSNLETVTEHPQLHYQLKDQKIPNFEKVIGLVKKAHPYVSRFRLISWDIAIDEVGDPVLIEANFSLGGINELQVCNGPLFGRDTKKILDEVFENRHPRILTYL